MGPALLSWLDRWLCPPPARQRAGWLAGQGYAHRGLHGPGVPENSPAAFAAAIARGLGIECDVQRTADGRAVVFHDWELGRLTGEEGPVQTRTAMQLGAVALKGGTDAIPTLEAVLAQVGGQVPLLIEIKSKRAIPVAPLCAAVNRALRDYSGQVAVMSFDPRVSRWFGRHAPQTVRGLVVTEEGSRTLAGRLRRHLALWAGQPDFLAYDIRDLPSPFATAQRKRGLPLLTWTVRSHALQDHAAQHADAPIAEGEGIS